MPLPPHAVEWMNRAEIDYLGPFVKAWAAFNAWYRRDSGHAQERAMLDYAIRNPNSRLRRRVLPLLANGNAIAQADSLKQAIYDLHLKLDAIQFEVTRKGTVERVSLRAVCLRPRPLDNQNVVRNGHEYRAQKIAGGEIRVTVTVVARGIVRFQHVQPQYDPNNVYEQPTFTTALSVAQRANLRAFYGGCNPRPMSDLLQGGGPALEVGAMTLQCTPEDLLAGLVETIYTMRNALLHGEVDPDEQVLACYEPAYRIVMSFLAAIA